MVPGVVHVVTCCFEVHSVFGLGLPPISIDLLGGSVNLFSFNLFTFFFHEVLCCCLTYCPSAWMEEEQQRPEDQ